MTITTTKSSDVFPGNGSSGPFDCTWRIFDDTDVTVALVDQSTGASTPLVLNTDYTISGAGNQAGFTVATVSPVVSGKSLYVKRALAFTQPTDFTNQGAFFPTMHEDAMDRLEMQIQQQNDDLGRSLKANAVTGNVETGGKRVTGAANAVDPGDLTTLSQVDQLVTGAAGGITPTDVALFSSLASTAAGKGAELIGFQQSGTSALASNIKAVLLGFFFTPQMYGAKGDDTTDDTAAVQAWVNACQTYGFKGYVPAVASGYKLTGPINVTQGLQIYGDGCEPHTGTVPSTGTATRGRGSWFHLAHAGIGFYVNGGANGRSGVKLANIATYRDQPAPTGGAYTPGAFDYDIVANTVDLTVEDVMLLNPTKGISHTNGGYGRLTIRGLRGQPLSIGVNVSESYDTGRVRDVHFWPFWTSDAGVKSYILSNGIAFNLARWDNPDFTSCFAYGYAYFFYLTQNANGKVGKLAVSNCDLDVGGYFLYIDATVSGAQVQLVNCRTQGATSGSFPANFANVQIMGSSCRVVMANTELRYPQGSCVRVQGSNNTVHMANMTLGGWNQALSTYTAVDAATSGNTIRVNTPPLVSEAGGSGTLLYKEASGATVSALLASGVASVTTITGGYATITHNSGSTARKALLSTQGGTPYFVQATSSLSTSSTTFDVQVFAAGGASVAAGVNLNVFWELRF